EHAIEHILENIDAALHLRPESARVYAYKQYTHYPAAYDTHHGEYGGQHRHGDYAAPKARHQHPAYGIDRHDFHGGNLFARLHQADFGGQRSARPSGKQQGGDHRPKLTRERERHQQAQRFFGAVAVQRVIALQPQHKTHEQARYGNDQQRIIADEMDLLGNQP